MQSSLESQRTFKTTTRYFGMLHKYMARHDIISSKILIFFLGNNNNNLLFSALGIYKK